MRVKMEDEFAYENRLSALGEDVSRILEENKLDYLDSLRVINQVLFDVIENNIARFSDAYEIKEDLEGILVSPIINHFDDYDLESE